MADVLDAAEINAELARHAGWAFDGEVLHRTFDRADFNGSIAFVNAIAAAANRLDHHPDLGVSWNEVTVRTSSHDVKGISARDFALIAAIDAL
jgi:4a-hydroxytetrahydrobiopterin dehydratase